MPRSEDTMCGAVGEAPNGNTVVCYLPPLHECDHEDNYPHMYPYIRDDVVRWPWCFVTIGYRSERGHNGDCIL